MSNKKKSFYQDFLSNTKQYPILYAIATGLYPITFYFSNNFKLVNTWGHLGFFLFCFILCPIVGFLIADKLSKYSIFDKTRKYILPFLNVFMFLGFMSISYHAGIQKKVLLLIFFIALILVFFIYKYLKKIIVLQFILAFIGLMVLLNTISNQIYYSEEWLKQPDDIVNVVFKSKPNVYFIQPDGYENLSELKKGYYNIDNSYFENFLLNEGFENYPNFRSNYPSTLSSNSSIFMMKHHYYNNVNDPNDALNARKVIITKNTVLDVFKKNGYNTHLILEAPYLLLNRPELGYDDSNFNGLDIPFIGNGFRNKKNILESLNSKLETDKPQFFFIEFFDPGHIRNDKSKSRGIEGEKEAWAEKLEKANQKIIDLVTLIKKRDPNALIMILSDHGGYVGLESAFEIYTKTEDRDILYSILGSNLSIHWPNNDIPKYDENMKSAVNVFRFLFSYLSKEEKYLDHLEEDGSYLLIFNGATKGVYKCIDENGNITFEKK